MAVTLNDKYLKGVVNADELKGMEPKARTATGTMRVNGHVRGYISGMVDGDFSGILHGQLNATVSTDGQPTREGPSLEQLTPGQATGEGGTDHA